MTFRQLESFVIIVENGSFLKAADTMFISSQALNQQINNLEQELGFKLLVRSPKGVSFTPMGKYFYDGAKDLLVKQTALISGTKKIADEDKRTIYAGFCYPLGPGLIPKIAAEYMRRFHRAKVVMTPTHLLYMLENVASGQLDICEFGDCPHLHKSQLDFLSLCDFSSRWICLMSSSHPLASHTLIRPEDLTGSRVVIPGKCWYKPLDEYLKKNVPGLTLEELDIFVPADNEVARIGNLCLNDSCCVSIQPFWASKALSSLTYIPFDFPMKMEYGLAYKPKPTRAVQEFLAIAKEMGEQGCFSSL